MTQTLLCLQEQTQGRPRGAKRPEFTVPKSAIYARVDIVLSTASGRYIQRSGLLMRMLRTQSMLITFHNSQSKTTHTYVEAEAEGPKVAMYLLILKRRRIQCPKVGYVRESRQWPTLLVHIEGWSGGESGLVRSLVGFVPNWVVFLGDTS